MVTPANHLNITPALCRGLTFHVDIYIHVILGAFSRVVEKRRIKMKLTTYKLAAMIDPSIFPGFQAYIGYTIRPQNLSPFEIADGNISIYPGEQFCRWLEEDGSLCSINTKFVSTQYLKDHVMNCHVKGYGLKLRRFRLYLSLHRRQIETWYQQFHGDTAQLNTTLLSGSSQPCRGESTPPQRQEMLLKPCMVAKTAQTAVHHVFGASSLLSIVLYPRHQSRELAERIREQLSPVELMPQLLRDGKRVQLGECCCQPAYANADASLPSHQTWVNLDGEIERRLRYIEILREELAIKKQILELEERLMQVRPSGNTE
ncbi:hypothetical protein HJFPF1_07765 [Paramyrothecium foliicola]|nr:hypothetical protein HJFPF1_07765 [Paramyrothecium foliicola]